MWENACREVYHRDCFERFKRLIYRTSATSLSSRNLIMIFFLLFFLRRPPKLKMFFSRSLVIGARRLRLMFISGVRQNHLRRLHGTGEGPSHTRPSLPPCPAPIRRGSPPILNRKQRDSQSDSVTNIYQTGSSLCERNTNSPCSPELTGVCKDPSQWHV